MKKNKNITIVIAEDSITQAEQLRYLLEEHDFTVWHGTNGIEALKLVKQHHPSVIISDILMPEMDGYQLCRKIKKDKELKHIPVILVTLLTHPADIIKGLECGAENFITKPYEGDFLLSLLRRIISNIELRRESHTELGLDVHFDGRIHRIDADRVQILDLLLSSIENSVRENKKLIQTNEQLRKTRTELKRLNQNLESKVETRTAKITRLNSLLSAIRNINQLIVVEKNPERLLQVASEKLTRIRNYQHAVCIYLDQSRKPVFMADYGLGKNHNRMTEYLIKGNLPACCIQTLDTDDMVIIRDNSEVCNGCPLKREEEGMMAIVIPFRYNNRNCGMLLVRFTRNISPEQEETDLLREVAGDLAFALYDIELRAEHDRANRELAQRSYDLNERVKELHCLQAIDELLTLPGISFSEVFLKTIQLIRQGMQFPDITACRVRYDDQEWQSENFIETEWSMKTDLVIHGEKRGFLEVCYIREIAHHNANPFFKEEIFLHQTIARHLDKFIQARIDEDRLKSQHKLLNQLINSSPELITVKDQKGRYMLANTAFYQFNGLSEQAITGKTDTDLLQGLRVDKNIEADRQVIEAGKPEFNIEEMICGYEGHDQWFLTSKIPLSDESGKTTGLISISRDITEIKHNSLELIKAKEKAIKADSLKTAFLMNMSHEIRTPLNAIIGFSELLSNPAISNSDNKEFLRIISENGLRLLRLINDILDISKIESGLVEIEPRICSLKEIISDLFENLKSQSSRMGKNDLVIRISEDCQGQDLRLMTDPDRLRQIISNLLDNALKFTEKGYIELGWGTSLFKSPAEEKSGISDKTYLRFFIKDTGIGIKREHFDFIFNRFSKVEDKMKLYEGTGLGLTISKDLVHILGGGIWLESYINEGTSFFFTIPYDKVKDDTDTTKKTAADSSKYDWKNKLILVAEDEESNYSLIKYGLHKTFVRIQWAKNGKEAVEMCLSDPSIDLVLMDIKMPEMDGLEATRHIRKSRNNLPVISVTAYATTEDRDQCREAGCDDCISKPINVENLLAVIDKYFGK